MPLHPIDIISASDGALLRQLVDGNLSTISPVNKAHPRRWAGRALLWALAWRGVSGGDGVTPGRRVRRASVVARAAWLRAAFGVSTATFPIIGRLGHHGWLSRHLHPPVTCFLICQVLE